MALGLTSPIQAKVHIKSYSVSTRKPVTPGTISYIEDTFLLQQQFSEFQTIFPETRNISIRKDEIYLDYMPLNIS